MVGFQRPDFSPVCIPRSEVLALGVVTLVADTLIILFLLVKHMSTKSESTAKRSRVLLLSIAGAGLWTVVSVHLIAGKTPGLTSLNR